jgi:hypothetical protein
VSGERFGRLIGDLRQTIQMQVALVLSERLGRFVREGREPVERQPAIALRQFAGRFRRERGQTIQQNPARPVLRQLCRMLDGQVPDLVRLVSTASCGTEHEEPHQHAAPPRDIADSSADTLADASGQGESRAGGCVSHHDPLHPLKP